MTVAGAEPRLTTEGRSMQRAMALADPYSAGVERLQLPAFQFLTFRLE